MCIRIVYVYVCIHFLQFMIITVIITLVSIPRNLMYVLGSNGRYSKYMRNKPHVHVVPHATAMRTLCLYSYIHTYILQRVLVKGHRSNQIDSDYNSRTFSYDSSGLESIWFVHCFGLLLPSD